MFYLLCIYVCMHTIQTRNSVPVFQSAGNPVPIGIPAESGRNMQPRCHSQLLIVTVRNGCVLFPPSHLLTLAHAFSHFLTLWQSYTSVSTVTIHKKSFVCKTVGPKSEKIEKFQTKNLHFFRIFLAPLMLLIPHRGFVVRGFMNTPASHRRYQCHFFPADHCNATPTERGSNKSAVPDFRQRAPLLIPQYYYINHGLRQRPRMEGLLRVDDDREFARPVLLRAIGLIAVAVRALRRTHRRRRWRRRRRQSPPRGR